MTEKYTKKITANQIIQVILFLLLIAIDQLTKHLVVIGLKDKPPIVIIDKVLELYNNSIFFILIFFNKDDVVEAESSCSFVVLEFLKK